jgi:two-component system CheB/CheR fusion protein
VKIARDLTGHKRTQDEQDIRLAATQTSNNLKDEFFAVMSHELKHPLNLIQLNAELLQRLPSTKSTAPAVKAVRTICEAVSSQARIIDDLLDVARVRTGKLKLNRQAVDLGQVLRDIHAVVINGRHPCEVTLQLPGDAPSLIIDADNTRLEQIIWNLVNNALKFTPEGGRIELSAFKDEDMAQLDVTDSGIGLSEEDVQNVFDLFSQAEHQHATHQREGLGIGLSLVRQLVEAHGGSVDVYSAGAGRGCTFSLRLPLSQPAQQSDHPIQVFEDRGRLHGLRVLLVDDSAEVLEVMQMLLEMEDAQVAAFSDPRKALDMAAESDYDVIISDIGMPVLDGHQLISAIRKLPQFKLTPAIALTGYATPGDQKKTAQSGFTHHVGKPISHDSFVEVIEKAYNSAPRQE